MLIHNDKCFASRGPARIGALRAVVLLSWTLWCTWLWCAPQQQIADMVLYNGKIATIDNRDSVVSAVAIKDGVVMQAGNDLQIRALAGPLTSQINLKGKTVTPGLVDSHYHMMYYGQQFWPGYLNIRHPLAASKAELLQLVGDRAKQLKPDEWISGNQGFHLQPNEKLERWDLDKVTPKNPVYLRHSSGQYSVVNSLALQLAKIDRNTPNPPGSLIVHDAQGEPTGVLSHYPAENLVGQLAPGYGNVTDADRMTSIEKGQQLCLQAGYTSVQDVIIGSPVDIQAYRDFADSGRLKIRVYALLYLDTETEAIKTVRNYRPFTAPRFKFGGWKLAMDGGFAAGTILMYDKKLLASAISYPYFQQDALNRTVQLLHDTGLQVAVHVSGDQGVDMTLTAFEEAMRKNPRSDPRHRIEHGLLPSASAVRRMRDNKIILSTQPQWTVWHADGYALSTNAATMETYLPLKTMLDMGVPLAFGCDVPASIYQEPKWAFAGAIFRRSESGTIWNPEQRLTIREALRIHTMGSAYAGRAETTTGSLEPGKYADLVVWSLDLLGNLQLPDYNNLAADLTMVNGEVVYHSGRVIDKCACDINGDRAINAQDFQVLANAVLGVAPIACGDLNGDGSVNILDIQILISSALDPQGRCLN